MICEADGRTRLNHGWDWTAAKWHFEIQHRQPLLAAVSRQLSGSNGGEHSQVTASAEQLPGTEAGLVLRSDGISS